MEIYNVRDLAEKEHGEYILGSAVLKTHACYLVYGVLKQKEKERIVNPGNGHEEIFCLVSGEVLLRGDSAPFTLKPGQAFHIRGKDSLSMENSGTGDAVYLIAGGHSERHEH
jgi:hypothetical protein